MVVSFAKEPFKNMALFETRPSNLDILRIVTIPQQGLGRGGASGITETVCILRGLFFKRLTLFCWEMDLVCRETGLLWRRMHFCCRNIGPSYSNIFLFFRETWFFCGETKFICRDTGLSYETREVRVESLLLQQPDGKRQKAELGPQLSYSSKG